jgi:hypothetical protein
MACSGGIRRFVREPSEQAFLRSLQLRNDARHLVARSQCGMIAGNPNTGKRTATAAVALLLMIILVTGIISSRKKTAPAKEPPLHPPVLVLAPF